MLLYTFRVVLLPNTDQIGGKIKIKDDHAFLPLLSLILHGGSEGLTGGQEARIEDTAEVEEGGHHAQTQKEQGQLVHRSPPSQLRHRELLFLFQGADRVDRLTPVRSCSDREN